MYKPKNKAELLRWFKQYRASWAISPLKTKTIKELYAIYYKTRGDK